MSAVIPLQVAIDTKIQGDATLAAKLRGEKVYSLQAPESDNVLPYIVLGQSTETRDRLFGGKIQNGVETIDVWSGDVTKFEAAGIGDDLERLFDGQPLVVTGHAFICGELSLVALLIDQSGKYAHASYRYEVKNYV